MARSFNSGCSLSIATYCTVGLSLLLVCCLNYEAVTSSDIQTIYTTEAFNTPFWLNRSAGSLNQSNYEQIEVMASLAGHPDLPRWMSYYHRKGSPVGYFYGTPEVNDDGDIDIEIVLLDTHTYNTTKDALKYRIHSREETFKYEAQIKLFNLDLEDFIRQNISVPILEIFQYKLWQNESLYVTKLARPIEVGGRYPLDSREKEGVVVRVGGNANFTSELLRLESEVGQIRSRIPCPKRYKATSVEYMFRERQLRVDWCRFQLRTTAGPISEAVQPKWS